MQRCTWPRSELDVLYHDREWGVPQHDDRALFEMLTLEGAQAGLSWSTILKKRDAYRDAFANFEFDRVARFSLVRMEKLMANAGIVRNRLKIESTVSNAKSFRRVVDEYGTFDSYVWTFVAGKPLISHRKTPGDVPPRTPESDAMSADLKKRGFRFVGSTICYAFMQATGMVNDHLVSCFRFLELSGEIPVRRGRGRREA